MTHGFAGMGVPDEAVAQLRAAAPPTATSKTRFWMPGGSTPG